MPENELFISGARLSAKDDKVINISNLKKQKNKLNSEEQSSLESINEGEETQNPAEIITPLQDLIAGGVSGIVSIFVGHPFDTIKVRLQMGSQTMGSLVSLFRGIAAPMSTAAVVNAVIFSSFGWSSRIWESEPELTKYDAYKSFWCGSFAGLVQCAIICPVEHLKCRLQVQEKIMTTGSGGTPSQIFRGPCHLASHIISEHGALTLFRGWNVTVLREVPAFGLYFSSYNMIKDSIVDHIFTRNHPQIWTASALAGGISGILTWAIIYPFDVVKTRIQTSPFKSTRLEDRNIWHVGKHIIQERGVPFMFRGFGVTCLRAFPVNGIIFPVYEFTLSQLR